MTRLLLMTCAALIGAAAPALAQAPARQREPRGFDFSRDGVWRQRARAVRNARRAALRSGNPSLLNAPMAQRITGTLRTPVLLVTFTNRGTPPRTASQYFDALFATTPPPGRPYTVRTYYEEISNGAFSVQGEVVGWLMLDSADAFYEGNCNGLCQGGVNGGRMATLIREAVQKADATIDFRQFDNDGPDGTPNSGDDDGLVDLLTIVHAEQGGECVNGSTNIWAHRHSYAAWTGGTLVTQDLRGGAGSPAVRVNDYTVQSGVGGATSCDPGTIMPPGTVAHETGHGLGLPDLYDFNPDDEDNSEGIGHWGLMGSGNYAKPYSPAYMEGFSRLFLGWVTVRTITASGSYSLGPYAAGDTVFRINPTGANSRNEYYLLENRQSVLSDSGLVNQHGPGLLVWHVDPTQYDLGESSNTVNSGTIHGLALEQADGLGNLRSSTPGVVNRGDAGDPFPGSSGRTRFGFLGTPRTLLNTGVFAGFMVDSIRSGVGNEVLMRIQFGALTIVRGADIGMPVIVRGQSWAPFQDLLYQGDTLTISADTLVMDATQQTRYRFLSWSDGGARTHQISTSAAGGTITASASREFRVTWSATNGGTVTASPALTSGTFMAENDSVTLTASAAGGQVFNGWAGDTATTNAVLRIRATRPFNVIAQFGTQLVAADTALRPPVMGAAYNDTLRVSPGPVTFALRPGSTLPSGLTLSSTGVISGIPTRDSTWTFTVRASGTAGAVLDLPLRMAVTAPAGVAQAALIDHLLEGSSTLSADQLRYVDLLGNANGSLDIGDVTAWLDRTGQVLSARNRARLLTGRAR